MKFTESEFRVMVDELLFRDTVSFDMLYHIAEKSLKPTVKHWCKLDSSLRGRGYEEDILQEIYLRLVKNTVTRFLLRESGKINDDPHGFHSWMFKVAANVKADFSERVRKDSFNTESLEELPDREGADNASEHTEKLRDALQTALESDTGIYQTLTWLAQFVFIIKYNISKIESNAMIVKAFEHKTLNEMYAMLLQASEDIPWLEIDDRLSRKITAALNAPWDNDTLYGQVEYGSFFMKKGGKQSISDWVNRMNNRVRRSMESGTSEC